MIIMSVQRKVLIDFSSTDDECFFFYFQGDVWAESTMLGFYWHYYALMEGRVYDITEWMKCHVSQGYR